MPSLNTVIEYAAYAVLLFTACNTGYRALRHRDRPHVEVFLLVGSLAVFLIFAKTGAAAFLPIWLVQLTVGVLLLGHPWLLVWLVGHFRRVPFFMQAASVIGTIASIGIVVIWPRQRPPILDVFIILYFIGVIGYAVWALAAQAWRTSGVTAWRLGFAAAGAGMLVSIMLLVGTSLVVPSTRSLVAPLIPALAVAMVLCYYLGLASPRVLRRAWQRQELYRYLEITSRRNLDDRARLVFDDLMHSACRATGAFGALVVRDDGREHTWIVTAATDPQWLRTDEPRRDHLVGLAEADIAAILPATIRAKPLLVPIGAGRQRRFGWLVTLSRYGSLFPADDVDLLGLLADHAADVLEQQARLQADLERVRLEQDQERQSLEASRQRLADILDAGSDFVTISQIEGPPLYINASARRAFGLGADEPVTSLFEFRPPDYPAFFRDVMVPHLVRHGVWRGETEYRSRDGRLIPVSQVSVAHRTASGEIEFVSSVSRDISDQRALEQQLRQSQKMEAIGRLAGGVAHDFNNLLTAILGYSKFVLETFTPSDARHADMEAVVRAAERAASLTRQLLIFSRKQIVQPVALDLNALVSGIQEMLGRLIGEDINLVTALAADLRIVRADPGHLEQVVMNLAVNARDAMPTGGRLTIETANVELDESYTTQHHTVKPGSYVMLAMSDNGIGMDDETKRRLFEPFFTTKEPGKGTGLGLATVHGIVKESDGHIWVYSELGAGTTFKIYLPTSDALQAAPIHAVAEDATVTGTETLLVVEDEEAVRFLTRTVLERAGFHVIEASNPEIAEKLFAANPAMFDLIVTDVIMPGSSGPKLYERLARIRPGLKVLYVSGYTDDAMTHQGQLNPGVDFLEKPFTAAKLRQRVREVLDRK